MSKHPLRLALLVLLFVSLWGGATRAQDFPFYASDPAGAAGFDILSADPLLWIDTSTLTNSTTSGRAITDNELRDQGPLNWPFMVFKDGNGVEDVWVKPNGSPNGLHPSLIFSGDCGIQTTNDSYHYFLTNTAAFTVVEVWKVNWVGTADASYQFWNFLRRSDAAEAMRGFYDLRDKHYGFDETNTVAIVNNAGGWTPIVTPGNNKITSNAWYCVSAVINGTNSLIRINGTNTASGTLNNASYTTDFSILRFVTTDASATYIVTNEFLRALVFKRAIATNELWQIEKQCMDDYGIYHP